MERWDVRATLITGLAGVVVAIVIAALKGARATAVLVGVAIVLAILLAISLRRRPKPVKSRPRLVFRAPSVEPRVVGITNASVPVTEVGPQQIEGWLRHQSDGPEVWVWCVYGQVENVPEPGDDGELPDAKNVHATLRFIDAKGRTIKDNFEARWSSSPQDASVETTQAPATQDLPANGGPYKLDVAIKYRSDPQCYAWNDQSRFKTPDLKDVGLGEDYPVKVEINFEGSGVTASATYLLNHSGLDMDPPTMVPVG
jgi:hypothetical protein